MVELNILEKEIKDAIVSVGWTHKIQEKQAEIYATKAHRWTMTQLISAGFAAASTAAGIPTIINNSEGPVNFVIIILTTVSAWLSFISSGILKTYNFKELSNENKAYANQQFILREQLTSLYNELLLCENYSEKKITDINDEWKCLNEKRLHESKNAPLSSASALEKASRDLKEGRHNKREEDYHLFFDERECDGNE